MNSSDATILLTVDVEDWFQVENLRSYTNQKDWNTFQLRVEPNVYRLLTILSEFKVQATFFVLGWIAERCPDMVREISSQGHEIASHGYLYRRNPELTVSELGGDLAESKEILEKITGKPVRGYRAPNFNLTKTAEDLLPEVGYKYDSSFNSFSFYSRYGTLQRNWQRLPDGRLKAGNGLIELPVSNLELGRLTLPWGGGAYFRL